MSTDERWIARNMLWMAATIERCGMAIIGVGYGGCSFPGCDCGAEAQPWSYTVGLVEAGHPELVTFGPTWQLSGARLNWVRDRAFAGRPLEPSRVTRYGSTNVRLDPVPPMWVADHERNPMGQWFQHYQPGRPALVPPPVLQLVWADRRGIFPDEPGCDPKVRRIQPVLADEW